MAATGTCNVPSLLHDLGLADSRLLVPGDPDNSLILARMTRVDDLRMPPLGSHRVDGTMVEAVREWITGLDSCHPDDPG